MRLSGMAIQNATRGQWLGAVPAAINAVVTDTRHFKAGQTFLALRGPHFDGHLYARDIADKAEALIGDRQGVRLWDNLNAHQLQVGDTLQALGDIAHAWRKQLCNTTIIGISGSYAKTSLRSLLEHGLRGLGLNVSATRANLNNLIGVPQTLMSIPEDAEFGIVECGISEPGEMQRLAQILQPDIAVLTGLSAAHGEGLGGLQGIAREKALLLEEACGWCALGDGVAEALQAFSIAYPHDTLVADSAAAVRWQLSGTRLTLSHGDTDAVIQLALPARHWAANMALAAGIILRATEERQTKVSLKDIARVLGDWQPAEGRMQQRSGRNGSTILDDCYNANPASMQAALDTLAAMPGKHVAILGDMAELGEESAHAHAGLNLAGVDQIFLIGQHMKHLAARYPEAHCFADTDAAVAFFDTYQPAAADIILIKASRSMALERIATVLAGDAKEASHAV
ncbi:MAG: UDP-N-acetylmuramoyl-tripeptide--D-alanyl-D-alanine ligase [Mariprofundaceae bacterium]